MFPKLWFNPIENGHMLDLLHTVCANLAFFSQLFQCCLQHQLVQQLAFQESELSFPFHWIELLAISLQELGHVYL